jgi:hypothetical protein
LTPSTQYWPGCCRFRATCICITESPCGGTAAEAQAFRPSGVYVGFYLDPDESQSIGLETTAIGVADATDTEREDDPAVLKSLQKKLDAKVRDEKDWKTFAKAVQMGTDDLKKNKERFESTDPAYQLIDLDEARSKGLMPLPYTADR